MTDRVKKRLLDLLAKDGHLDRKRGTTLKGSKAAGRPLERIIDEEPAVRLGQILVEAGWITPTDFLNALAAGLDMPPINLSRLNIHSSLTQYVPERIARTYRLVPVSKIGDRLSVAMADPLNLVALDDLSRLSSLEVIPLVAVATLDEQPVDVVLFEATILQGGAGRVDGQLVAGLVRHRALRRVAHANDTDLISQVPQTHKLPSSLELYRTWAPDAIFADLRDKPALRR